LGKAARFLVLRIAAPPAAGGFRISGASVITAKIFIDNPDSL